MNKIENELNATLISLCNISSPRPTSLTKAVKIQQLCNSQFQALTMNSMKTDTKAF